MTEPPTGRSAGSPRGLARRIVLTTLGSLGDVSPYLAIACGLQARGHEVIVATGEYYRSKVEAMGLEFRPLRPDSSFVSDPRVMGRIMDHRWGTIRALREVVLPAIRQTYEDTMAAADGADLLVGHTMSFANRLVAEKTGISWVSTQITPLGLSSKYDPPALPIVPELALRLRWLGPHFWGPLRQSMIWATKIWAGPIRRLRAEIGLPRAHDNPLVEGHSPSLVLALFSKLLADKQRDWPVQTVITGFPVVEGSNAGGLTMALQRFLDDGPPPVVFTLGISAAMVAGRFFEQSIEASQRLGVRAVLAGCKLDQRELPEGIFAVDSAPFAELFPRASAIVHAGGIGTSGLAMRSGRPMLVVPHAHDQPDNAARLARLGISRTIPHNRYTSKRVEKELTQLIEDPSYARKADEIVEAVRNEHGVKNACEALERLD